MTFLNSILNQSKKHEFPFVHWEYDNALSNDSIEEIIKADIPDVSQYNLNYDGTRAIDGGAAEFRKGIVSGGKAIKFRRFVTKENASQFPNLVKFVNELQSKEVTEIISKMINKDLNNLKNFLNLTFFFIDGICATYIGFPVVAASEIIDVESHVTTI